MYSVTAMSYKYASYIVIFNTRKREENIEPTEL